MVRNEHILLQPYATVLDTTVYKVSCRPRHYCQGQKTIGTKGCSTSRKLRRGSVLNGSGLHMVRAHEEGEVNPYSIGTGGRESAESVNIREVAAGRRSVRPLLSSSYGAEQQRHPIPLAQDIPPSSALLLNNSVHGTEKFSTNLEPRQQEGDEVLFLPPFLRATARFLNVPTAPPDTPPTEQCDNFYPRAASMFGAPRSGVGSSLCNNDSENCPEWASRAGPSDPICSAKPAKAGLHATLADGTDGNMRPKGGSTRMVRFAPQTRPPSSSLRVNGDSKVSHALPTVVDEGANARREAAVERTDDLLVTETKPAGSATERWDMVYTFGVPGVCCGLPHCSLCPQSLRPSLQPVE
ncbi:uncharacterized protein TEOVI_000651700 [Trypanosoma equiperdum]|uniref:T. brucei spp.-specific protein n=1 Tax=Trypanosoma equiperdum TaxID=5694 RepID=A0A1G4HZB1_TRYEQ|nr:hypothetical protein, conserved [Trypanosoma equiperdum]